jgi:glucose/arabinose dehydrogenase/PKD repeat protein
MMIRLLFAVLSLLQSTVAVPVGFIDEGVTTYPFVMSAVMVPNIKPGTNGKPMLLLAKKEGSIDVMEDPDNSDVWTNILTFTEFVCENGPRGVQSIVADPDFISNGYLYVYYTRFIKNCPTSAVTGPSNRLSRFTLNKNTLKISMSSEFVLLETPPSVNLLHDGGAIMIGNDKNIYLGAGDGGNNENGQNLRKLWGKLIRITLDGKVPRDNPYTGNGVPCRNNRGVPPNNAPSNAVCEEIYGYGLRNPFRLGEDIHTKNEVRFSICDVGGKTWEEITYGGTAYKGKNYGWSDIEGPCERNSLTNCSVPKGNGIDPYYYYAHNLTTGNAVVGVEYVPKELWPTQYKVLFVDHNAGAIFNLIEDQRKECRTCQPPTPGYRNATFHKFPRIVDTFFGPYKSTQALYYLSREKTSMNVRRIYYTGSNNQVPKAKISGIQKLYIVGEIIKFKGELSSDADGDKLTYLWNFGDGSKSTAVNPQYKYKVRGSYKVSLKVTDTKGQSNVDIVIVDVGTRPNAKIELPLLGTKFEVGDVLHLKGKAFDYGLNRSITNPSQYFWEVRQHHENHYHPFLELQAGNDFDLYAAPAPEDFYAASNSYLRIEMTVYDSNGVSRRVSRIINPKKVYITIVSKPSGLIVLLDNIAFTTPTTVTVWQNQVFTLEAKDQGNKIFSSWSIGGNRKRNFKVKSSNDTITAFFTRV